MSGTSILKDGTILIDGYGFDLHKLNQDDRVGLMRTAEVTKFYFYPTKIVLIYTYNTYFIL